jgi:hypothetical protein
VDEEEIRQARGKEALSAVAWSVGSSEALFWSFAIGAAFGPAPLHIPELIAGTLFSFALGMITSSWSVRRRLEVPALVVAKLQEGRKRKRIAVYEEYLTIDDEVVSRARLRGVVLSPSVELELSLVAPESSETEVVVQRVFRGARPMLARVRDELSEPAEEKSPAPDTALVSG